MLACKQELYIWCTLAADLLRIVHQPVARQLAFQGGVDMIRKNACMSTYYLIRKECEKVVMGRTRTCDT